MPFLDGVVGLPNGKLIRAVMSPQATLRPFFIPKNCELKTEGTVNILLGVMLSDSSPGR